jgi:acetyl esterase/lipase
MMIRKTFLHHLEYFYISAMLLLFFFTGCGKIQPEPTVSPYLENYSQQYGPDALQRFDLILPEGHNAQTRLVLLIHGGGWISGDKWYCEVYAKRFATAGFATVSMNYRLANDSIHYRDMLDDIDSMLTFVSKNSARWGIEIHPVSLFGYSAGGHLALLYAYARNVEHQVGAVISLAGVTNLADSALWNSPGLYDDIVAMTGEPSPDHWTQANPVHYVRTTNPPTFLIHGTKDEVVPLFQSLAFNQILKASNIPVKLMLLDNETHTYSPEAVEKLMDASISFLHSNVN